MFGAHAVGGPANKAYVNLTTSARAALTGRTTTPILGEEEPASASATRRNPRSFGIGHSTETLIREAHDFYRAIGGPGHAERLARELDA